MDILKEGANKLELLCRKYIHSMMMGGYTGERYRNKIHHKIADELPTWDYNGLKKYLSYLDKHIGLPIIEVLQEFESEEKASFIIIEYGGKLYDLLKRWWLF